MSDRVIDLRSDTVTCPDEPMRRAIFEARVGDAGYDDDPSVNELQEYAAFLVGKEKALFMPSGIMGNLVATMTHTRRGESALVGRNAHIYAYEAGGLSAVSGLLPRLLDDSSGCPSPDEIEGAVPEVNVHFAQATLLCLENTHNDCGGVAISPERMAEAAQAGRRKNLAVHLDGARLFNASVYWKIDVKAYTDQADSVQFCLSKGLGAPMGSMLCGSADFIAHAQFNRKRVGGEMREVGFMAAAGLYALRHNIDRLAEDHRMAAFLGKMLRGAGLPVEERECSTNMIYFPLPENSVTGDQFLARLQAAGVLGTTAGPKRIRLVTHMGINDSDVERAADVVAREYAALR
ncbi:MULTISPECIES: GntG family PLP-dependent aldolase [Jonquetella]|uniref:Threonine aldolase n=1 Tax=Jonquetella anthropi DSM 22815 TaxID=885272 RepID=H0UIM5_9BACT|nr:MULTISPECIES: GntG family PLP-dependent aldolase [Jonquetella]EEX49319.1 Beta-eliminating lyase [Jonquetella anthropi E3_33 E1]EHM13770.1 threonine aldolase [Jonquetella anthropi DSM 22815]ERL24284.1 putative glycine hydroxymethyltransferase [Jonquetella sp. BV3C21]